MQRYHKKMIKGTQKFMMNYKPAVALPKQRNSNTAPLDQGVMVSKIDRFDKAVDKHSMRLYLEDQRERLEMASSKRLQKESKR